MDEKSSFLKRTISKEDAIIQVFRPALGGRIGGGMDAFDRTVAEAETLTQLGTKLTVAGTVFHLTPNDLKTNLDEFEELVKIATLGREFLNAIGYVSRRQNTPMVGTAPVGKNVEVTPIAMQLPGSEELQGAVVTPK